MEILDSTRAALHGKDDYGRSGWNLTLQTTGAYPRRDLARKPILERLASFTSRCIKIKTPSAERPDPSPSANKRRIAIQRRLYGEHVESRNVACAIAPLEDYVDFRFDHDQLSPIFGADVQFIG